MRRGSAIDDLVDELRRLRLRQTEVIIEIRDAQLQEAEDERRAAQRYRIGDRVGITTTRASRPAAVVTGRDLVGTVTGATPTRVDVVTDNGFHTWRAPRHVNHLF